MKEFSLLIWLTQLGFSVVVPPVCFILLAVWLHNSKGWGQWVIWAGVLLGVYSAIEGLRASLKAMSMMTKDKKEKEPPVSFNEHA